MANYDSTYATSVLEKFERGQISTLHAAPVDMLIDHVVVDPVEYGKKRWKRPVLKPEEKINSGAAFTRHENKAATLFQELDLRAFFDSIAIERSEMAGYPEAWQAHAAVKAQIIREGINQALWDYEDNNPVVYGVLDYPSATTGTLNRPEQIAPVTTAGAWSTTANMRADFISAIANMESKGIHGPYLGVMPSLCKPMVAEVITNTAVPQAQWLQSTLGIPCIYDNSCDIDATTAAFDAFVLAPAMIHVGMTPMVMDDFYDDKDHSYYIDWETYLAVAYDTVHDGTEYLKPVCKISAAAW